jgi:hypothetical protein
VPQTGSAVPRASGGWIPDRDHNPAQWSEVLGGIPAYGMLHFIVILLCWVLLPWWAALICTFLILMSVES